MLAWASARKPFVEYLWRTSDEVQRQLYGTPCFCLYRRISVPARDRVRLREVYCNTQSSQFLASFHREHFSRGPTMPPHASTRCELWRDTVSMEQISVQNVVHRASGGLVEHKHTL